MVALVEVAFIVTKFVMVEEAALTSKPPEMVAVPVAVIEPTPSRLPEISAFPCTESCVPGLEVPTPKLPYSNELPVTCRVDDANNPPVGFTKSKFVAPEFWICKRFAAWLDVARMESGIAVVDDASMETMEVAIGVVVPNDDDPVPETELASDANAEAEIC